MPIYVYHGGNNSDGTSWANAYTSITNTAVLEATAGSEIWIASDHVEEASSGFHINATFTATGAAIPHKILSIKRSDDSYETMAAGGGRFETVGANDDITLSGQYIAYGLKLVSKDMLFLSGNGKQHTLIDCYLDGTDQIYVPSSEGYARFVNCTILPRNRILCGVDAGAEFVGCTFPTVNSTAHITAGTNHRKIRFESCDLSAEDGLVYDPEPGGEIEFVRCKLATSYVITNDTLSHPTQSILIESCIAGTSTDPVIGMQRWLTAFGTAYVETTVYRSGGASDGTTSYSWKMDSSSLAQEHVLPFKSRPITRWVASGAQTLTIHINHEAVGSGSGGDLQNDEIWLEVISPNESSPASSLGRRQTTLPATIRTTPSDLTNNSETWNSAKSVKQQLSVSITPTEAGPVTVYVCLGKPSVTVYVDPKIEVS